MGWAHGIIDGREVGYGVEAICDHGGCDTKIDRGLAYRCGGPDFDVGCGGYFCAAHLFFTVGRVSQQMCEPCCAQADESEAT